MTETFHEADVEVYGKAETRRIFRNSKLGDIAGCFVIEGVAKRGARLLLVRDGRAVWAWSGPLSLRRFKDDVVEVKEGFECGVGFKDPDDGPKVAVGDQFWFVGTVSFLQDSS